MDPTLSAPSAPTVRGAALVGLGGAVGTLARYLLGTGFDTAVGAAAGAGAGAGAEAGVGMPWGVLVVNVTGAFALGVLVGVLARGGPDRGRRRDLRLLLGTGLLGGYTTYSLLAADIAVMLLDHRPTAAAGYGLVTLAVGGLACWVGVLLTRGRSRA